MKPSYDESLIKLRFLGDQFKSHSIPIYELGVCLIEVQRMIHKAHLIHSHQQKSKAFLPFKDRSLFSLQLSSRKKASDGYGLSAILNNPEVSSIIGTYVGWIIISLTKYAKQRIATRPSPSQSDQHIFNIIVYNQVRAISARVENIGGIEAIELSATKNGKIVKAVIDKDTKKYVNQLKDEVTYGMIREVTGTVIDFMPAEDAVVIKEQDGLQTKVLLSSEDFKLLRYSHVKNPRAVFSGEPMYRMGVETYRYESLRAELVRILG